MKKMAVSNAFMEEYTKTEQTVHSAQEEEKMVRNDIPLPEGTEGIATLTGITADKSKKGNFYVNFELVLEAGTGEVAKWTHNQTIMETSYKNTKTGEVSKTTKKDIWKRIFDMFEDFGVPRSYRDAKKPLTDYVEYISGNSCKARFRVAKGTKNLYMTYFQMVSASSQSNVGSSSKEEEEIQEGIVFYNNRPCTVSEYDEEKGTVNLLTKNGREKKNIDIEDITDADGNAIKEEDLKELVKE